MIVFLMGFGAGMEQLRIVEICFTSFCVSYLNEREKTVSFGSAKKKIISVMD